MNIDTYIDYFIHSDRYKDEKRLCQARLFVKACLLTALFSTTYVWLSVIFHFDKGVYLMVFNVVGFLALAFLTKTRLPIEWLGNAYVLIGAIAVITLAYFSGGMWSAIYPWIISIPVLAILVVDRWSGLFWGIIAFAAMIWMGILAIQGVELPKEYDTEMQSEWYVTILPGLLLIILFISFVFEANQRTVRTDLEKQNAILRDQKKTITDQAKELERLIEEKDYIIRILAHDLKNPLKNITGLIKLMEHEPDDVHQKELTARIMQSTSHAQDLIDRVLEMDASNQGFVKVDFQLINVLDVVYDVINGMESMAAEKSISIKLVNSATEFYVEADKIYLALIFENLLSNAVKFSQQGQDILVHTENMGGTQLLVKFIDNGPGISADEEDKLFKKFSKLSARPTSGESSTGLGLALVKHYIELIKGDVTYERSPGLGATFVVNLPLVGE